MGKLAMFNRPVTPGSATTDIRDVLCKMLLTFTCHDCLSGIKYAGILVRDNARDVCYGKRWGEGGIVVVGGREAKSAVFNDCLATHLA